MVFSSVMFLFFFMPFVWTAYYISWNKARHALLLLASIVFYVWGETGGTAVLLVSILFNYVIGLCLDATARSDFQKRGTPAAGDSSGRNNSPSGFRKTLLILGITGNLGLLISFKYTGFLLANLHFLHRFQIEPIFPNGIHAPIGISFFTFHALSYLLDIYRFDGTAQRNPLNFSLYLAMFPKILAGPILQYRDAEDQLPARHVTVEGFAAGIHRFVIGLGKKTLIATPLAGAADKIFAIPADSLSPALAWLGIFCFTLQIYFDFSGYSDMAIGLGKTFGFRLPENFNYPYISQSVQEFWRRWHISLSLWFRDYLYIPLGGNRCGTARRLFNLLAVFLLCGLWHGAGWNCIVWGLWYGIFLVLEKTRFGRAMASIPQFWRHLYTLAVVIIGWVFFRSESLSYALGYLKAMLGFGAENSTQYYTALYLDREVGLSLLLGMVASLPFATKWKAALAGLTEGSGAVARALALGSAALQVASLSILFLLSCMSLAGGTHNPFIYFKF
jgi:alginate O-acetyltransferase complex protein AlgI